MVTLKDNYNHCYATRVIKKFQMSELLRYKSRNNFRVTCNVNIIICIHDNIMPRGRIPSSLIFPENTD